MGPESYVKFAKIGALSASGSRPFDARGKSITAPNPAGQHLALARAYELAEFGLDSVDYLEAHGTGRPVGDAVEVQVLVEALERAGSRAEPLRIGSVKSQVGHLKSAAGVVGVIKAALALDAGIYPPSIHFETPNTVLRHTSALAVQTRPEPWPAPVDRPRRAGVSSFGFGGTNFHLVLEGTGDNTPSGRTRRSTPVATRPTPTSPMVRLLSGSTPDLRALGAKLGPMIERAEAAAPGALDELIEALGGDALDSAAPCRFALVTSSVSELVDQLRRLRRVAERAGQGARMLRARGVFLAAPEVGAADGGELVMLFPGQGSQYLGMLGELQSRFPLLAATLAEADEVMAPVLGCALSELILGMGEELGGSSPAQSPEEALRQTSVTQPAVLTCDVAILRLLDEEFGLRPDMVAGHSLGEYAAAVAAGVFDFADALRVVAARSQEMTSATPEGGDPGWMAAVAASVDQVESVLDAIDGYVSRW